MWQHRLSCSCVVSILSLPHGRWANLFPGLEAWTHIFAYLLHSSHPHGGLATPTDTSAQSSGRIWLPGHPRFHSCHIPAHPHRSQGPPAPMHALSQGCKMAAGVCLFPHLSVPALLCRGLDTPVRIPAIFPCHNVVAWTSLSHACQS